MSQCSLRCGESILRMRSTAIMSRSKLLVISLVMLLLALVARIVAIAPNAAKDFGAAPDIVFPAGTAGLPARLSELKGKVVILDFWATWCGPCRMSIPELVHLYEKYKDKGLVVVGVSTDEPETLQNIPDTVEELKINYPIVI